MKKFIISIMLFVTLFSSFSVPAGAQIKLAVNNEEIDFKNDPPILINSRTYVPVRFLAQALGAEVDWDDTHKVVIIKNYGIDGKDTKNTHYLRLGENKMVVYRYYRDTRYNEQPEKEIITSYYFPDDIYPIIVNDRTMLPFRYVAELLGSQVYYDPTTGTAHCVRRDYSPYYSTHPNDWGFTPIFSTVIGDYFADELNKWYNKPDNRWTYTRDIVANNYFDGTLGDVTAWAGIDHFIHPEWRKTDEQGHSETAHKFTGNLENEVGCYKPFYRTYLPNVEIYSPTRWEWQEKHLKRGSYGENQVIYDDYNIQYASKKYPRALQEYNELVKNWGIKLDKQLVGITNMEKGEGRTGNIYIYDEETYRQISQALIRIWASSPGHLGNVLIDHSAFGVSIVGGNAYYITFIN